jgi:tight adherence protein B
MVGDELPAPINKEFKTVFEEINFGLPFNDAMSNFAIRVNSNDVSFLVVGLVIQREAGGNLIGLLENLAKTVRDRMILNGKVRVLASEGKYSGILLSVLPFLLGGILAFINPKYMALLWTTDIGQSLMISGLMLMSLGALWMWKITRIKV